MQIKHGLLVVSLLVSAASYANESEQVAVEVAVPQVEASDAPVVTPAPVKVEVAQQPVKPADAASVDTAVESVEIVVEQK